MTKVVTIGVPEKIIADENFSNGDLVVISGVDSEERVVGIETHFFVTAIHVGKFESEHSAPWGIIGEDVLEGEEVEELYLCTRWYSSHLEFQPVVED